MSLSWALRARFCITTANGHGFLVIWQGVSGDLLGARLDGAVPELREDADLLRLAPGVRPGDAPLRLASDGRGTSLAVWQDGSEILATRINEAGASPASASRIRRAPAPRLAAAPASRRRPARRVRPLRRLRLSPRP
ncbi:hypothetical protein [Sorangium sp. So ce1182]|uniref:hypothetical protein n=1 Tax=Sorangium sp. So ce1182 TaxID=3133334 RepID=UPI003F61DF32